jgi:hypothetical protein
MNNDKGTNASLLLILFRLHSCEAAYGLLQTYTNSYQTEVAWVDESYGKLNNLAPIGVNAKEQLEPTRVMSFILD